MTKTEIISKNDLYVNKLVSSCMRYALVFILLVWTLNQTGVFVLDKTLISIGALISAVLLIVPTIIINVFKANGVLVKYVLIVIVALTCTVMYAFAGYHATLFFILPTTVASLYCEKNMIKFTAIISVVMIIVAHLSNLVFNATPDEPLNELYYSVVYGIVPHIIIYLSITAIIYNATKRSSTMLNQVLSYSHEITKNKNALDIIIAKSRSLHGTYNISEFANQVLSSIRAVVGSQQSDQHFNKDPYGIVGYRLDDNTFNLIDETSKTTKTSIINSTILINLSSGAYSIPLTKEDIHHNIIVTENIIKMLFYYKDKLEAFILFESKITADIQSLRDILGILYSNIKLALINNKLNGDMFKNQVELVHAFAEISESKSRQTGQHIKRVSEYMYIMGNFYGYNKHDCDNLSIASMMHDVGKLLIPTEILEKPGKLTKEEFDIVKQHTLDGHFLLENAPGEIMQIARVIALQHHEKWDGTGYMGISGENIDFNSRIMAIIDVFDALVSRRSYKESWTPQAAYDEILSQSGKHFDPQVVWAFKKCYPQFLEILENYPDESTN